MDNYKPSYITIPESKRTGEVNKYGDVSFDTMVIETADGRTLTFSAWGDAAHVRQTSSKIGGKVYPMDTAYHVGQLGGALEDAVSIVAIRDGKAVYWWPNGN